MSQFANSIFLLNGEGWQNGTLFWFVILMALIYNKKEIKFNKIMEGLK